jgi:SAM-dependent methyltransferase
MNESTEKNYYEENSEDYFNSTVNIDPGSFLNPLIENLSPGSTVLDIGCGSGRDLLWLKKHGFKSTGFERSSKLAAMARSHSECEVIEGDFTTFDFSSYNYDCLVSIGAFVHLVNDELASVLPSLLKMLNEGGLFLLTLKQGDGYLKNSDGRLFTLWQHEKLQEIFGSLNLSIINFSIQTTKLKKDDIWLGYLLKS